MKSKSKPAGTRIDFKGQQLTEQARQLLFHGEDGEGARSIKWIAKLAQMPRQTEEARSQARSKLDEMATKRLDELTKQIEQEELIEREQPRLDDGIDGSKISGGKSMATSRESRMEVSRPLRNTIEANRRQRGRQRRS